MTEGRVTERFALWQKKREKAEKTVLRGIRLNNEQITDVALFKRN